MMETALADFLIGWLGRFSQYPLVCLFVSFLILSKFWFYEIALSPQTVLRVKFIGALLFYASGLAGHLRKIFDQLVVTFFVQMMTRARTQFIIELDWRLADRALPYICIQGAVELRKVAVKVFLRFYKLTHFLAREA